MSKTLNEAALSTPNARKALAEGNHWRGINADVHLGYRKQKRGGRWMVRWYRGDQKYKQATIGTADDGKMEANGADCLSFEQAKTRAAKVASQARADEIASADGPAPTVGSAVQDHIAAHDVRQAARGESKRDIRVRLTKHVSRSRLATIALHALTESDLGKWRASLADGLASATVRRIVNDLRAALNAAAMKHRARLPAETMMVIKAGLATVDAETAQARDKAALPDADIRRIIQAASTVDSDDDWGGDLLRMVLVLSATGSRFSQVKRNAVADLQIAQNRLMVPTSRKGRGKKKASHIGIRIGSDVLEELRPAIAGRRGKEPLLERWRHKQEKATEDQPPRWVKSERGPWLNATELARPWSKIIKLAGLPADTVPYALRHSSIVRQLRAGLPVRLVAALHDTSARMIELHYSAAIVDALDDLSAGAVIPLVATSEDNVVRLRNEGRR
ncbi:integrase [Mesorhizobium sp. VNQ89]|uniref:tyrosine-type recombinase/integrase n=1 Tax=Mesorhizobium quangtriensis TaxID=3157709 RepID=UPI0032B85B83